MLTVTTRGVGTRANRRARSASAWTRIRCVGVIGSTLVFCWRPRDLSRQIGVRLGQISEFSLLVAVAGLESGLLSKNASYTIQTATLVTFVVSTYWIVLRYPTPVAVTDALRRD